MESQVKKVDSQKCIGYQKVNNGKINSVFQNSVKHENGSVKMDWQIQYADGGISLPLGTRPRIDIAP